MNTIISNKLKQKVKYSPFPLTYAFEVNLLGQKSKCLGRILTAAEKCDIEI